jgi:hypothetical protein
MQNKTAIKIGMLMVMFSILNGIYFSVILLIVLLFLAYLIINTKTVEKLWIFSNTEKSEDIDILFSKGLKSSLIIKLTITIYQVINTLIIHFTKLNIRDSYDALQKYISYHVIDIVITIIAYFIVVKLYENGKAKFTNTLVSAISFIISFYLLSFKISYLVILKIEEATYATQLLLYYFGLVAILLFLSNKISVWFVNSNDNKTQLSTGIKLTAAALFVCLVFDFEMFSYMLYDGFNMLDFLYYTFIVIAMASFVFNKKLALFLLNK